MCLPLAIASPFSIRVFFISIVTLCVTMLPMCVPAATAQLTCTISDLNFGNVVVGQSETQVVVVTNSGQTAITVSALNVTNGMFGASQLPLPLTMSPGQSVPLNVTFSPTVDGWTGGYVEFSSDASNPTLYLEVEGMGTTSETLAASPSSISFGQVAIGASSTTSVVLSNSRSYQVQISGLQTIGGGFSVSGPAFPITLDVGQSVTVNVSFAPQSAGTTGGSLWVSDESLNIPLTGTGTTTTTTTAGQLSITPSQVNFGDVTVGSIGSQAITLSATGASVTVSSDASSSSQFVLEGASLPFTIPAGQSLSFNVAFQPTSSGTVSGSLSFTSNAANSQTIESLTGVGMTQQHTVNLTWNASSGVAGYNIYRSTSSAGPFAKINSTLDANTAFSDSAVVSGQTYYYEATAVDSSGQESVPSSPPVAASIP
jgi:hypothetical protein